MVLMVNTFIFLGDRYFNEKTSKWKYFHELVGIPVHLEVLEQLGLPSPNMLNMQGPESLNAITGRTFERVRRGVSHLGLPTGKLDGVFALFFRLNRDLI